VEDPSPDPLQGANHRTTQYHEKAEPPSGSPPPPSYIQRPSTPFAIRYWYKLMRGVDGLFPFLFLFLFLPLQPVRDLPHRTHPVVSHDAGGRFPVPFLKGVDDNGVFLEGPSGRDHQLSQEEVLQTADTHFKSGDKGRRIGIV